MAFFVQQLARVYFLSDMRDEEQMTPPWPYKTWEAKKNAKVERVGDKPKRLIDLHCDVIEGVV